MIMQRLPSDDSEDPFGFEPSEDAQVGWMYRGVPQDRVAAMARFIRVDVGQASSELTGVSPVAAPAWLSLRRIVRQAEFSQLYFG